MPVNVHVPKRPIGVWYSSTFGEGEPGFQVQKMPTPRIAGTATPAGSLYVFVMGGHKYGLGYQSVNQVYNYRRNLWASHPDLSVPRGYHGAAPLPDGRILVFGGANDSGSLSSAEVYDPDAQTWSAGPSLPEARHGMAYCTLEDARVFLATGIVGGAQTNTARLFDPQSGAWRVVASLPGAGRQGTVAAPLPGNRAGLFGGGIVGVGIVAEVYAYDPASDSYAARTPMPFGTWFGAAVALEGEVVYAGGKRQNEPSVSTTMVYDPFSDTWSFGAPIPGGGMGFPAATPFWGKALFAGGAAWDGSAYQDTDRVLMYLP